MPKLKKLLARFNEKERGIIMSLIKAITSPNWQNLDIKKLKGQVNIFRVRRGQLRIIFRKTDKQIFLLSIERKNDNTYNI